MAMTPKGWSISALAVELNLDRRTVAARLRDVPPCGTERGHAVWRLGDAVRAIEGIRPAVEDPPPPEGFEVLAEVPPHHRGFVTAAVVACYNVAGIAYRQARALELPYEQARNIAIGTMLGLMVFFERDLARNGVPPFSATDDPAWMSAATLQKIAASLDVDRPA